MQQWSSGVDNRPLISGQPLDSLFITNDQCGPSQTPVPSAATMWLRQCGRDNVDSKRSQR